VRLHRVDVLREERLLDARDEPFIGEVDAFDLDLGGLAVEEDLAAPRGELADRLVGSRPAAPKMRTYQPSAV
jgi:hypothetical protein